MPQSRFTRRTLGALVAVIGVTAVAAFAVAVAFADGDPQPVDFTHNVVDAPAPVAGAVFGTGPAVKTGSAICTTPTQVTPNVNTDCETSPAGPGPHNETSIAVNPTDLNNMIGGANDYQLGLNSGGHVTESISSRAHVTFDGGHTWSMYPVFSNSAYQATGDPAVAFDNAGNAYYGTLGFRFVGPGDAQNPDVLVSTSTDKGKTWTTHRIASGSGVETSVGDLLDKEYVTAWGNGNAIVTYGDFRLGQKGAFETAQIYSSVTHDGGNTWSTPQVISGSDVEAFVSVPVRTTNGRVFVTYMNTFDNTTGRDTYRVVEVSPATGARIAGPFTVSPVIDGNDDYPFAFGRPTYHDSVFRTWAAGNITADPKLAGHLAVVWSDMRDGPATDPDPYKAQTNSDVIVSQSFDYGRTWSAAVPIARAGDQWMPWGEYDTNGLLRIGTFDRGLDPLNHTYDYSLATETAPASLAFAVAPVTTVRSDPTRDDRWFSGTTLNPAFPHPTSFIGDYSNIAIMPDGSGVVSYWTDLRNPASFAGRTGHGEDAYFAKTP
jgi:hypothetical protein